MGKLIFAFVSLWVLQISTAITLKSIDKQITFQVTGTANGLQLEVSTPVETILTGLLFVGNDVTNVSLSCIQDFNCQIGDATIRLLFEPHNNGFALRWETTNTDKPLIDCFDFEPTVQWYGGPQRREQVWPIQNMKISSDNAYVSRKDDNFAVAERYWLNSKGLYLYVDEKSPLFVSQNEMNTTDTENNLCFISKLQKPYVNRTRNILEYHVIVLDDLKQAHLHAVNTFLGKPKGNNYVFDNINSADYVETAFVKSKIFQYSIIKTFIAYPNPKMIAEPIWTTWAEYKRDIDDQAVLNFARTIRFHGYKNGQIEIDDSWEKCYGAQEFTEDRFSNISGVVRQLKNDNFRVTLWVHPFVNEDCQNNTQIGKTNGYFVKAADGLDNATWWNGNGHQIDFTNPEAAKWWSDRLKKLQTDPQIDNFKFDAGETDYGQQPSLYPNIDQELIPNILTSSYIRTCAEFGDSIEVRSAWRTQDLGIFVRMLDKDTKWGIDNGLASLITTLFQLNLNGYTMVLPDMIGGNGYNGEYPTAELIVRWTQANTFMPAMQFSYLPWEITSDQFDSPAIVQNFVNLHANYSDVIINAMNNSVTRGTPVNPPIWWIDPTDPVALATNDEYLLGDSILVAPVLQDGARSRKVYLPKGKWIDGNNGTTYVGPVTLDYPAPIEVLPYFIIEVS